MTKSVGNSSIKVFVTLVALKVIKMRHADSHEEVGMQPIDLFCIGAWRQQERSDSEWYAEFQHRIASTVRYQF